MCGTTKKLCPFEIETLPLDAEAGKRLNFQNIESGLWRVPVCGQKARIWMGMEACARLAEVRSVMASASVIASGLAPIIMGFLIDADVSLERQAVACLVYTVLASAVATRVRSEVPDPV